MERHSPHHVQRADEVSASELAAPPTVSLFLWITVRVHESISHDLKFCAGGSFVIPLGGGGLLLSVGFVGLLCV